MQLNEVNFGDALPVEGYGPGFFRVGGQVVDGALLASPTGFGAWDGRVETVLALRDAVDVVLYGAGADLAHPPSEFRTALEDAGLGVEPMGSASACRTYNVLLGEGRRVALVALPV